MIGTVSLGPHQVPGIWQFMLPEDFQWMRAPDERQATCANCYRVAWGECREDCRCCTYFPQIPNFMLGLALDDAVAGPQVLRLIEQAHTLPQGLVATPEQYRKAVEADATELFGQLPEMVCPFVDKETFKCGVYAFRNSICSTFFCVHDHGAAGQSYWDKMQALVGSIEMALADWVMDRLELPYADYVARLDAWADRIAEMSEQACGAWTKAVQKDLWGAWYGRERAFFVRAADLIKAHRDELYNIACAQMRGDALILRARRCELWIPDAYRANAARVPEPTDPLESIESLWYKAQLAHRKLWELPFNEGKVALASGLQIEPNPLQIASEGHAPMLLRHKKDRLPLKEHEAELLRVFETPQTLGEALFARPEVTAHENPRGFLAECMRRGFLVACTKEYDSFP